VILESVNSAFSGVAVVTVQRRKLEIDVGIIHESLEGCTYFIVEVLQNGFETM
jgi:hypothetical protein